MQTPVAGPTRRPLWRNLNFTLMWTSTAASGFGDQIVMRTAWVLLGGLTATADSTSLKAGVHFFFFIPYLLLSLPAGWLADRVPRKWIMFACDQTRGLAVLLAFYMLMGATGPAHVDESYHLRIILILLLAGSCAATFNPARNAVIPEIIPRTQLQPANAVILGINVVASMCGVLIFKAMTSADDIETVRTGLKLSACFYFVSGWFFAFLKPITHHHAVEKPPSHTMRAAVTYTRRHRRLIVLIIFNMLLWSAAALINSSIPGIARTHHNYDGDRLLSFEAFVSAAVGFGMLAGAILIGTLGRRRESTSTLTLATAGAGLSAALLATVPVVWASVFFAFLVGVFGNIAIVTSITTIQCLTPNYIRGRIMGLTALSNTFISVLTYCIIWRLPDTDSIVVIAVAIMGLLMILVGAIGFYRHLTSGPMDDATSNALWRFCRFYILIYHRCRWVGKHHVPSSGKLILAANHTTGLDPLTMQGPLLRPIRWVMLTSYLFWPLNPLWRAARPIALELGGTNTAKIRTIVATLNDEDAMIGIFPEGALQRTVRELKPLQPGIVMMQRRSGAPIVPIYIHGTPLKHAMAWHFLWPGRVTVVYGRPWLPPENLSSEDFLKELTDRMNELQDLVPTALDIPSNA
ncbi:MAG: MFS transporter [Phycisphaeraceae bacterium]